MIGSDATRLTVFFGGNIGCDPASPKTWSGSGPFLLRELEQAGMLAEAVGLKIPPFRDALLRLKNFSRRRAVWRTHYYFDPQYRSELSRAAGSCQGVSPSSFLLQLGHMYDLRDQFPRRTCFSYHDGNLAVRLASGFGFEKVSRLRIDQALRYEEETACQMDVIFTMSECVRQSFISDYHVPPYRVCAIGGGINLSRIPPIDLAKDYCAQRILFVGSDFQRKGGPQLLQAFRILREAFPRATLDITGPGSLPSLPPGVFFHGFLSKADPAQRVRLEELFRGATIFALPSLYEPFGIAPLEAMLYQVPCVVTNAWALRESVCSGLNGELVPAGDADALASALMRMLSDPGRLARMGREARNLALSRHTWGHVVERMRVAIEARTVPCEYSNV
jgi:glycosyltransferase involved in cell wall biosynthesis